MTAHFLSVAIIESCHTFIGTRELTCVPCPTAATPFPVALCGMTELAHAVCSLFCYPPIPSRIVAKLSFVPPVSTSIHVVSCQPMFESWYPKYIRPVFSLHGGTVRRTHAHTHVFHHTCPQTPPGYLIQTVSGEPTLTLTDAFGEPGEALAPPQCKTTTVTFRVGSHQIVALYAQRAEAQYTVLLSHGNAEDIGLLAPFIASLTSRLKVSVFAYDYPGYGSSEGQPSEALLYKSIEAAWVCLRQRFGVPAKHIILYGTSIGSAPSVHLAAKFGRRFGEGSPNTPAGMVLHAPLASGIRVLRPATTITWCCDPFANVSRIEAVTVPTLIIHGTHDEIVPVSHSYKLASMCQFGVTPLFIQGAGHNDLDSFPAFYPRLVKFIEEIREGVPADGRSGAAVNRLHADSAPF